MYKFFIITLFFLISFASEAAVINAFDDSYGDEILYIDQNIVVTDKGVYSRRTGKIIEFTSAPDWEEEDFFTQQEKYCEKDAKSKI